MKDLGKTVKSRDSENSSMDNDLAELNVTVNERRHIDEVNGKYVTMDNISCFINILLGRQYIHVLCLPLDKFILEITQGF